MEPFLLNGAVVYFDQGLGAAYSKRWLKNVFFMFFCMKNVKRRKNKKNEAKNVFWGLEPNRWSKVLFPEKKHIHREKHVFIYK